MGTVSFVDSSFNQTFKNKRYVQFGIIPCTKLTMDMSGIIEFIMDLTKQSQKVKQQRELIKAFRFRFLYGSFFDYKEGLYGFEPKGFWGAYSDCLEEIQRMADQKDRIPFSSLILNNIQQDNRSAAVYPGEMVFSR